MQIEGIAEKMDGATLELLKEHIAKRDGAVPHKPINYKDYKPVGPELCWYKLTSKKNRINK